MPAYAGVGRLGRAPARRGVDRCRRVSPTRERAYRLPPDPAARAGRNGTRRGRPCRGTARAVSGAALQPALRGRGVLAAGDCRAARAHPRCRASRRNSRAALWTSRRSDGGHSDKDPRLPGGSNGTGCSRWPRAALLTLPDTKQSLGPATGAGSNGRCTRYCGRRPERRGPDLLAALRPSFRYAVSGAIRTRRPAICSSLSSPRRLRSDWRLMLQGAFASKLVPGGIADAAR
jgi:hypothetical protein